MRSIPSDAALHKCADRAISIKLLLLHAIPHPTADTESYTPTRQQRQHMTMNYSEWVLLVERRGRAQ